MLLGSSTVSDVKVFELDAVLAEEKEGRFRAFPLFECSRDLELKLDIDLVEDVAKLLAFCVLPSFSCNAA